MDFKTSLDRYLTSEPQDDFTPWVEAVYNSLSDKFVNSMGEFEDSPTENEWLNKLYSKKEFTDVDNDGNLIKVEGLTIEETSMILERAAIMYGLVTI